MNETLYSLYEHLSIPTAIKSEGLDKLTDVNSRFVKDLKLNVNNALACEMLSKKEAYLLALSVAVNQRSQVLVKGFETLARQQEATDAEIAEVHACVSLMNANNVFYRFRHYLPSNKYYQETSPAIRMSVMVNPVTGKEFFELMSLAVSSLNGCERCVTSHEASVKNHGASEARIFEAVRLAAVIKSLCIFF